MIKELWLKLVDLMNSVPELEDVYEYSTNKIEKYPCVIVRPMNSSTDIVSGCSKNNNLLFNVQVIDKLDDNWSKAERLQAEANFLNVVDKVNEAIDTGDYSGICLHTYERVRSEFGTTQLAGVNWRSCQIVFQAVRDFKFK